MINFFSSLLGCADRAVVSQHLPLARTQSTPAEVEQLVSECERWIKIALNRQDGNERLKIPMGSAS